jgi:ferredoxin
MTVRVSVDPDKCNGHAQCNFAGPDVYELDDDGYCVVRDLPVPTELERQARDGAAACPELAITVSD